MQDSKKHSSFMETIKQWSRHYKGELIAALVVLVFCAPLFLPGHITYSDLAVGQKATEYPNYMNGVFNERFGTANWFNLPRITWISTPYVIGIIFGNSGKVFLASMIASILLVAVFSFGSLYRRLTIDSKHSLSHWGLSLGALIYALNPWVIIRVQHVFLLCGYALVPLAISWTWELLGKESWSKSNFFVPLSLYEWRKFLLLGFVVSSSFAGIHFGIYIILVMIFMGVILALKGFYHAIQQKCLVAWFMWYALRATVTGASFVAFAAYWFMPFALSIVGGIRPSQNNVNSIEAVVNFSRAISPENLLLGISYWWPMFDHTLLPETFWFGGFMLMGVVALGVLYSLRILLAICSLGVLFMATGTYFPEFAATYISIVFDSMYPFGDMVRDPNKLYGVFILPASIFFAYGFTAIEVGIGKRRQLNNESGLSAHSLGLLTAFGCALFFWTKPIYDVFFLGFYKPVEWPESYELIQEKLEALPTNSKVMYLPFADFAIDKKYGLPYPEFNQTDIQGTVQPKATGPHMCFDTRVDTYFPFEGNDMMIMYFYGFLHKSIEDGNVSDIGGLLSKAGITHLLLRRDYTYLKEKLDGYHELLGNQKDLSLVWEDEIMSLYEVTNAKGDAQYFKHLSYTTGGLERLLWFPRYFETDSKNVNLLFAYDGHNPSVDLLKKGELVDITSFADFWMNQLPADNFIYPADNLRTVSSHSGFAKLIITGHDWEHASKHYKLENHKFSFDMGRGLAFSTSPVTIPHRALAPPEEGIPMLVKELLQPWTFLKQYEHFTMKAIQTKENRSDFTLHLPKDMPPTALQMVQSDAFEISENQLYFMRVDMERFDIDDVDIFFRVGYYSKEGNRLNTGIADPSNIIPPPPFIELSQTFLTPPGTTHARLEILAQNPTGENINIKFKNMELFSLENFATPNSLTMTLPPREDYDEDGFLWIRYMCSPKGGTIHLTGTNLDVEVDTKCGPVSKLKWEAYPTKGPMDPTFTLTNKDGYNAINTFTWLSTSAMNELQINSQRALEDQTIMHIIDSVDMDGVNVAEGATVSTDRINGTMVHGVNGTLSMNVEVIKSGTYQLDILDRLPYLEDKYELSIVQVQPNGKKTEQFNTTIAQMDSRRKARTAEDPNYATTRIPSVQLDQGTYIINIQLASSSKPLIDWNDLGNKYVPDSVTIHEDRNGVEFQIPMWEKNWGSLLTENLEFNQTTPLMVWFEYAFEECRSLHGKLKFLDKDQKELEVVYLSETAEGGGTPSKYLKNATPPPDTHYISLQFMSQHQEVFSENAKFEISKFQLFDEVSSIGIDAIVLLETGSDTDWNTPLEWEDTELNRDLRVEATKGYRAITMKDTSSDHRLQFFESPVHHWIFSDGQDRIEPFALNAMSFGLTIPADTDKISSEIILNRTWNRGMIVLILGLATIIGLSIIIHRRERNLLA